MTSLEPWKKINILIWIINIHFWTCYNRYLTQNSEKKASSKTQKFRNCVHARKATIIRKNSFWALLKKYYTNCCSKTLRLTNYKDKWKKKSTSTSVCPLFRLRRSSTYFQKLNSISSGSSQSFTLFWGWKIWIWGYSKTPPFKDNFIHTTHLNKKEPSVW